VPSAQTAAAFGAEGAADPRRQVSEIDALFARRDQPAAERALTAKIAEALRAAPEDYEVLWRAARFSVWLGDGAPEATRKRDHGAQATALAKRAVARNSRRVEGHYYVALGVGIYSQGVGVLRVLREGREKEFLRAIEEALRIDSFFDRGGPLLAKGRYHYELPWPKRDLKKSADYLGRVLKRFPHCRRARLFLAETLLKDGEPARAKEVLAPVFASRPEEDPPEDRRSRKLAQAVAARIEQALR
jgi:hypothetical protein